MIRREVHDSRGDRGSRTREGGDRIGRQMRPSRPETPLERENPITQMGAFSPKGYDREFTRQRPVADERRQRLPRRHFEDDGPPVIGLGDHVPSFLLRPVTLKSEPVTEE